VNPRGQEKALAMIYNPLDQVLKREIVLPLHYAGLVDKARVRVREGAEHDTALDRESKARIEVEVPPRGATWLVFE
jgi:hypothetical protein